jgi:hypothetical protein
LEGDLLNQAHGNNPYRELGHAAIHAIKLEEAAKVVLGEATLTPADRAVLENAVRIARNLQKGPRLEPDDPGHPKK